MRKFLSRMFFLLQKVCTTRLLRERSKIKAFDMVSTCPNPTIDDLYMVYAIDDTSVNVVPWKGYSQTGKFVTTLDNLLSYTYRQAQDSLYKVTNKRIDAFNVIQFASPGELQAYGTRISHVAGIDFPLLGVFVEKHNKHVMLVVEKHGDVERGFCLVCDLTLAHTAGLTHRDPIYHIVRVKDIVNNCVVRPFCLEDIVHVYSGQWHRSVITDIMRLVLEAVAKAETKFDYYSIYAKGLTSVEKIHGENSTMASGKSPDPNPPSTPSLVYS